MAMVFSVQQGEHGPLVTYKLEVPETVEPAEPRPAATVRLPADVAPLQELAPPAPAKMGPLQPTTLGTVVMPAERTTAATAPAAVPESPPPSATVESITADYQRLFSAAADGLPGRSLQHAYTGETITLDQVNAELEWRRDTAGKLRSLPVGPRF